MTDVDNIDWVPSVNMGYRTINAGTVAKMNRRVRYQARCETKKNGINVQNDFTGEEIEDDDQRVRSSEFESDEDEDEDDKNDSEEEVPKSNEKERPSKPVAPDTSFCRMCLQDSKDKKSVFSNEGGHKISDMILTCFKIMVNCFLTVFSGKCLTFIHSRLIPRTDI